MLPCEAGLANFFVFPYGDVYPCNGLEDRHWRKRMGNIREAKSFDEIWNGEAAEEVRQLVATCPKNCWMVGTASPVMKKYLGKAGPWVVKAKLGSLLHKKICRDPSTLPRFDVGQDPRQGDLSDRTGPNEAATAPAREVPFEGDFEEDDRLVRPVR
jgi:radical SAM protein with 4Fe4S-binding SPASM domain